ncbi:hypothetical protein PP175_27035 (plasmid) [Aneurinibacillus sp. Ricciae_BoGa-3]|uniref:hypothetical protein n=1 Tax=Aneurinibacillus sp. Ricciae_BoGa-3 TaxID=3022697 RepID=UPI0023415C6C|nr:hypothetical protein [Aneurinibacillus sp. Ricciae_BoGa-3]WCK57694.1 hypothetical protein PP175_27035 [Aneurinibacillus sp. Ricciae_BoGa-3]
MITVIYALLLVAFLIALGLMNSVRIERTKIHIKSPFKLKWANALYRYSYYMPFIWFIDEKEVNKKTKDIKKKLAEANLTHVFNYRSFTTMKVGLLISSIVLFGFILLIINNGGTVAKFLFNIKQIDINGNTTGSLTKLKAGVLIVLAILNIIPNIYVKRRADMYKYFHLKDIPVVQLFIILMLRSKKTIGDILFALSRINTRYKDIFDTGYRMFIRNKEDGLQYIKESFGETNFKETINVLKEMGEYSREDSIKLLENNMQQIIEKNNASKRRTDLSKLVYSQSTIAIPFIAIIVLCFVPLAVWGIHIFSQAQMGF